MCGIVAIIGGFQLHNIDRMMGAIAHRGEDSYGTAEIGQRCALGMHRLSIIGAASGEQPLRSSDGSVHLVCNGEIYNHAAIRSQLADDYEFQTESDAEAVLALYRQFGADAVEYLDGMFAFVLYDAERDTFLAARDRYGIKPLYYLTDGASWYFASEAKAFLGCGLPIDRVRAVPPGALVTADGVRQWYSLDAHRRTSVADPALLRALLETSVHKHLAVDPGIKIGTYLSGGIDSSIITALAARHRPDLIAFTVGMEGSPDVAAARQVAEHLGIEHVVCAFDLDQVEELLSEAVYQTESYSQLVLEGLMSMLLAREVKARGVKVVLCGEGADEIFAGYGDFRRQPRRVLPTLLRNAIANIGDTDCRRLDLATMAHSLEARVPFLDPAIVEYGTNLPPEWLLRPVDGRVVEKWLLRKACEDLLPTEIVWRIKLAFDHGSGILHLLGTVDDQITDAELAHAKAQYPAAGIASKIGLYLFRIWRGHFGELGGDDMFTLFGHYPTLQAVLDARTRDSWGTGESADDLVLLEASAPVPVNSLNPA
ncbi:asparagine synthase-related protein [Nocardia sp. NBC_01499]|uniref:asparagine synthase-related protein n=1 Tax=Nocardia sp. NBC_01499 TaxID=2903597 RepID=UPI0038681AA4